MDIKTNKKGYRYKGLISKPKTLKWECVKCKGFFDEKHCIAILEKVYCFNDLPK